MMLAVGQATNTFSWLTLFFLHAISGKQSIVLFLFPYELATALYLIHQHMRLFDHSHYKYTLYMANILCLA